MQAQFCWHARWVTEEVEEAEEDELGGGTQGEEVHTLGPGPLTMVQVLLRHSVWVGGWEELGGGTHGDVVHTLGPGPETMMQD